MRTNHVLWALRLFAPSVLAIASCGDDETGNVDDDGQGGATTSTTATTVTGSSSATTASATSASTGATASTTGTTASATTATGGSANDFDACPGAPITVPPGEAVNIQGSTAGLQNDFQMFCAVGSGAPDAVYRVSLPGACSFKATATGTNGMNPAVSIRYQDCASEGSGDQCAASGTPIVFHQEPVTMWVIVQGQEGSLGDFTLSIDCGEPSCSDGVLNPGEACDFGPDVAGDTCTPACTIEATAAPDDCGDLAAAISIPAGDSHAPTTDLWFHNGDASDDSKGSCMFAGESGGKDEVLQIVPQVSGALTVSTAVDMDNQPVCTTFLEPECWYSFLYVRGADCLSGPELGCNGIDVNTGVNKLTVNVTAGQTYHLFVDGLNDTYLGEGPYTLHFNLQ
jgi:cysteine-rich repeat protein